MAVQPQYGPPCIVAVCPSCAAAGARVHRSASRGEPQRPGAGRCRRPVEVRFRQGIQAVRGHDTPRVCGAVPCPTRPGAACEHRPFRNCDCCRLCRPKPLRSSVSGACWHDPEQVSMVDALMVASCRAATNPKVDPILGPGGLIEKSAALLVNGAEHDGTNRLTRAEGEDWTWRRCGRWRALWIWRSARGSSYGISPNGRPQLSRVSDTPLIQPARCLMGFGAAIGAGSADEIS
jgi:hypothetical protein